jgi:PAS domain S-box-containing protein
MATDPLELLQGARRLAAVAATTLAGPGHEPAFDRLTRLATRLLDAPVSLLSIVDGETQWIKSAVGLPPEFSPPAGLPASRAVCPRVAGAGAPLVMGDAATEVRDPAAARAMRWGLRAYAGVPLVSAGEPVGVLCVADVRPRRWRAHQLSALGELAALAAMEIGRRRAESERERAAAALAATERLFRGVVEQSLVGICVLQHGEVRYANPRFREIVHGAGAPPDAPLSLRDRVHAEDLARVDERLLGPAAGDVEEVHEAFRVVRPDGSVPHLEVHGRRMALDGGQGMLGVVLDVTERVRAERERTDAVRARDRFYAMMSHELRTPISAVLLYGEMLLSGVYDPLTDPQREAVERAHRSAGHLLELINDLLDLSKLEAGRLEPRIETVEVVELIRAVAGELSPMAAEQGCAVEIRAAEETLCLTGDALRVRQILLNLLANALRFGAGHPVRLEARRCAGGVEVGVVDSGPGICADDRERIFDDFVQLGEGGAGTGLGLPVARRLAELQGGTLTVESEPGEGSVFRLVLPALAPALASGAG